MVVVFFFQAEDGIRDSSVTGVQTCALPICLVAAAPATTGSIGMPARAYSSARSSDSAQKWGGVHRRMIRNSSSGSRPTVPVAAIQPITGGGAPAAPPRRIIFGVRRLMHYLEITTIQK